MNTKVKGDKIKKGSVDITALDEVQLSFIPHCIICFRMQLTSEYVTIPNDEIWYEDGFIYGKPIVSVYDKIIFIQTENIEVNKEYIYKYDGHSAFGIKVINIKGINYVQIKGFDFILEGDQNVNIGIYPNTIEPKSDIPNIDPVVWKYICNPYLIANGIYTDTNSYPEAIRVAIENNAFACIKVAYENKICQVIDINEKSNSHVEMLIHTGSIEINISAKIISEDADYVWNISAI